MPAFTTMTKLARNGKQEFLGEPYKFVLAGSSPVGMIVGAEMTKMLESSGALDELREAIWELHDPDTQAVIKTSRKGDLKHAAPLSEILKEYGV